MLRNKFIGTSHEFFRPQERVVLAEMEEALELLV